MNLKLQLSLLILVVSHLKKIKKKAKVVVILILILPLVLYLIPINYIEANPAPCIYRIILHRNCIGCGMTRAVLNLINLNISRAFFYNKLVIIVFSLIYFCYGKYILKHIKILKSK